MGARDDRGHSTSDSLRRPALPLFRLRLEATGRGRSQRRSMDTDFAQTR